MSKIDLLQKNIRHYMGQDLDPLSLRELQGLEQQIDTSLKRIRNRKNQLMHESISELQKKERALQEQNNLITKKLKENEKTQIGQAQPNSDQNSLNFHVPPSHSHQLLPNLTIGGAFGGTSNIDDGSGQAEYPASNNNSTFMPPWMVRHVTNQG
ncbi:unnamed protein product [Withania somnifera]